MLDSISTSSLPSEESSGGTVARNEWPPGTAAIWLALSGSERCVQVNPPGTAAALGSVMQTRADNKPTATNTMRDFMVDLMPRSLPLDDVAATLAKPGSAERQSLPAEFGRRPDGRRLRYYDRQSRSPQVSGAPPQRALPPNPRPVL